MSYLEYEQLRDAYFKAWCSTYDDAGYAPYKAMANNDNLRNWFIERWEIYVEKELQRSYDDYLNKGVMTATDLQKTIFILSKEILWLYPQVLIREINRKSSKYGKRNVCK
ncbi:MAG: hypothetical protein Q4D72_12000 [Capnocytophaga sp.]|nr:hypothetical protein [Capnocytophaga sp.]